MADTEQLAGDYLDLVREGSAAPSSKAIAQKKDDPLLPLIQAVAAEPDLGLPVNVPETFPVKSTGCIEDVRWRIFNLVRDKTEVTSAEIIQLIRYTLIDWSGIYKPTNLEWDTDHLLDLRPLGEGNTQVTLTVRKSVGMKQITIVVPVPLGALEKSWPKNFTPISPEFRSDDVYTQVREWVVPGFGRFVWSLQHFFPNDPAKTYPDDAFLFIPFAKAENA
ncbi:MAG: hypothetical protein V1926_00630 [Candidatus Peregrinibacteria bacterium]